MSVISWYKIVLIKCTDFPFWNLNVARSGICSLFLAIYLIE